ncbi:hypothetical protein AgCh_012188 [Apium graveolens]
MNSTSGSNREGQLGRYALDVNVERVKDVIVHKKLLNVAHNPSTRIDSSRLFIFVNSVCIILFGIYEMNM